MARNRVDTCMFCNRAPCACNAKPIKTSVKKVAPNPTMPAKPKLEPKLEPKPIPAPPSRSAVPQPRKEVRPNLSGIRAIRSKDEEELARAITVLAEAGLLHRDELIRHRIMIGLPKHRVDALIWRQENAVRH